MSHFLLYPKTAAPTGRLLGRVLGIPFGKTPKGTGGTLIRWGSQKPAPGFAEELNPPSALATSSNKLRCLTKLREAGLPVPEFTTEPTVAQAWLADGFTVLGRDAHGFGGKDIRVYTPEARWNFHPHPFFTQFIPNDREYRVHIFAGDVIRTQRKYLDDPGKHTNPYIKNHGQGYVFRTPQKKLNQTRYDDCIAAINTLGLDFGAVDLVIDHDGQHHILEINSAPSCAPLTARAYVTMLSDVLGVTPRWGVLDALAAAEAG